MACSSSPRAIRRRTDKNCRNEIGGGDDANLVVLKRAEFDVRRIGEVVVTGHFAVIFLLVVAHVTTRWLVSIHDGNWLSKDGHIFDLENENGLPTLFSTLMLFVTAMAAGAISVLSRGTANKLVVGWAFAALCLLFMGMDEGMVLHERLAVPVQRLAQTGGLFYLGWVLPYAALVTIVAAAGLPFLLALPRDTRRRLILAAILFVGSSIGMEMLTGLSLEQFVGKGVSLPEAVASGVRPPIWPFLGTIEETGEMLAVALALRALLLHLVNHVAVARLVVEIAEPMGLDRTRSPQSADKDTP